jgi:hypothetical protein
MLRGIRERIVPLVRAGKSLEEIQAAKPTAQFDEEWGQGFVKPDKFVQIVHASLER